MAEIKDFKRNQFLIKGNRHKKTTTADESLKDNKSLDNMLARHRQLKLYTVLAVLALVGFFLLCAYFNWKNIVYTDYEVVQEHEWVRADDTKCLNLDGTLFSYSKDGMNCTDTRGNVIWNQTYEMQNPIVRTKKKTVAVGDYNGRSIYVANTQGNIGYIDTTMPIRDFCVSSNGIVAVILDNAPSTVICLYDGARGEVLVDFMTTMSKSGYPIAVDISDNGTQLAVSYVKAEKGEVYSSIGFYNFSAVGQNYTDNLVGGYGYSDAVVPLVHFMDNDTVFAVADNRIMFFRGRQKPESLGETIISEEIQSVFYDESHIGLVFFNSSGDTTYRMEVYDTNAKKVNELFFDMEYTDILFESIGIVIHDDSGCIIYNWEGKLKFEGDFREYISCLIPSGNIAKYTIVTEDGIQVIELH